MELQIIYVANLLVAGWIGVSSIFRPQYATRVIFEAAYPQTEVIQLVGCLWLGIACLSVAGFWMPLHFSPVLVLQLIYKSSWLLFVFVPAMRKQKPFPAAMAVFFFVWVCWLPFVIPWEQWFTSR